MNEQQVEQEVEQVNESGAIEFVLDIQDSFLGQKT